VTIRNLTNFKESDKIKGKGMKVLTFMNKYKEDAKGMIMNITHGVTKEGPGWRSIVYFKGCNFHCPWCGTPESIPFGKTELVYDDGSKEIIGREVTVKEVIREILPYQRFSKDNQPYGVTLSGGEATAQWNFYLELLKGLKYFNFHTAVETNCSSPRFIDSLPYLDLVFCDIKHMDPEIHRKLVGQDNKQVLYNIRKTYKAGKDLRITIPVVPGYNDSEENFQEIANFLSPMKDGLKVILLKYGRQGIYKWKALGQDYPLLHIIPPSNRKMTSLANILKSKMIEVDIS